MNTVLPRILIIAPFPPPIHGSAVVSQQIKNSSLINNSFCCDYVNLSTSRKMDEIGGWGLAKIFRLFGSLCLTARRLLSHRYDLCYLAITCHGEGFLKDAPFVFLCKLFGRRVVIHQHNKGMAKDVKRWPFRWLIPLAYKNAKVILLSQRLYPDIELIVPKKDVLICHNGIKILPFTSTSCKTEYGNNQTTKLLFISNLIESKGIIVLLDALKSLYEKGIVFQCSFVGSETKEFDANRFSNEVRLRHLNHSVFFYGGKFGDEKKKILNGSDIFIFPTFYENECFPLVLLEAMSYALPCITTSEGGIPDIIEDGVNGFITHSRDPQSLADCIEKLIKDEELRNRMGEAGRRKVVELFSESCFEKRFVECITQCLQPS